MKKSLITVLVVLSILIVTHKGRIMPKMTEITLAEPVFVLGIDKSSDDTDDVKLTIIYEKIEAGDEGGADINKKYVKSAQASSAAAAFEALKRSFPREIAASAADYFLISREAATEDLIKYIDFLSKNNTLRLTASVFIVDGNVEEACEILTQTLTLDILRNFGENSGLNAISSEMQFYEVLSALVKPGNAFVIPALLTGDIVIPNGYAIIKDGRLKGLIKDGAARGYNILCNKSTYSAVEIKKQGIATRLDSTRRKISFSFNGDDLTYITVDVGVKTSALDAGNEQVNPALIEQEQSRVIYAEINRAVEASKLYESDFLGFGKALRNRHPLRWEKMGDNWNEIYGNTPVIINVNSALTKY